jgi:DNA-binding transcriptional MerR regulator
MAIGVEAVGKSPDAFRTISEVAAFLETPAHVLRFWESKFPQIKPVKRAGGRRYYRPDDIALLGGIKVLLHEQGMTIRGVQKLLKEKGPRHVATLSALPWEGETAEKVPEEGPDAVIVGPWPGVRPEESGEEELDAGELDRDEEAADFAPEAKAEPELKPTSPVSDFLAGTLERLRAPPKALAAEDGAFRHLREALDHADRERLRAQGARLAPLVRRLAALRDGASSASR